MVVYNPVGSANRSEAYPGGAPADNVSDFPDFFPRAASHSPQSSTRLGNDEAEPGEESFGVIVVLVLCPPSIPGR